VEFKAKKKTTVTHLKKIDMLLQFLLILLGLACFALLFKSIDFFEKI